ncbi:MAG: Biopolymer transport protein ExbB [Alphaproteobacteria bacterium MarineAlpha9_Bin4]|nr:protein TolQ [Pelagibacterales bacterium]PPR26966.1 MAG: Biopolymer transport protein ExbB [Alphaproteobacteria bacterium MarineAlpha9_Bin4]|tara:strand:- start:941 stop:1645 length:705 start_codon:yes stop_codon:yes gene_type:complete
MNETISVTDNIDISIWGLILQADLVVRIVMLLLLMLSIFCWAIIFEKLTKIKSLKKEALNFENNFWSGIKIDQIKDAIGNSPSHPYEAVFFAGIKEWELATKNKSINNIDVQTLERRLERTMGSTLNKEMEAIEKNTNFLATTGSSAPFIGLFGTVWGIMNSFQSIATAKNTSLAIVAPGIAEALLATALGLLAAIPAVIFYNKISGDTNNYSSKLEIFINDFTTILARQIAKK